jgi:glycosyltransferase involved in cell wall biosynthesis
MAAMAHGIPVIAPNVSQMREVLPKAAHLYLFEPSKKESIINAIKALSLLSSKDYKQLRVEMLQRAEDYHPKLISKSLGLVYDARYS